MRKVALIGAGNRAKNYNLPILKQMLDKVKIVGIATKSGTASEDFNFLNAPVFSSITKMVKETSPDVMIISIKSSVVNSILDEVIDLSTPFLIETTDDYGVYSKIKQKAEFSVGVLEQWPFLPMEQFKKMLLSKGLLGEITVVENNFRTYDYHGAAQIRNYLPTKYKITNLKGFSTTFETEAHMQKGLTRADRAFERVRIKTGIFENGTLLIYKFSDKHKNMPFRGHNTLNVYGSRGSIVSDCLVDGYCNINILDTLTGFSHELKVEKKFDGDTIREISTVLPSGEILTWQNNYKNLSEHQIGTAYLFEEMLIKNKFIYGIGDTIQDMMISYSE